MNETYPRYIMRIFVHAGTPFGLLDTSSILYTSSVLLLPDAPPAAIMCCGDATPAVLQLCPLVCCVPCGAVRCISQYLLGFHPPQVAFLYMGHGDKTNYVKKISYGGPRLVTRDYHYPVRRIPAFGNPTECPMYVLLFCILCLWYNVRVPLYLRTVFLYCVL